MKCTARRCVIKSTAERKHIVRIRSTLNRLVGGDSLRQTDVNRRTPERALQFGKHGLACTQFTRHSPQKDMMWLLSACTNFLVTASSIICFTWETKADGKSLSFVWRCCCWRWQKVKTRNAGGRKGDGWNIMQKERRSPTTHARKIANTLNYSLAM